MGRWRWWRIVTDSAFQEFMRGLHCELTDAPPAGAPSVRRDCNAAGRDLFIVQPAPEVRPACCCRVGTQASERRRLAALVVGGVIALASVALAALAAHASAPYVMGTGALGMLAAFAVARG